MTENPTYCKGTRSAHAPNCGGRCKDCPVPVQCDGKPGKDGYCPDCVDKIYEYAADSAADLAGEGTEIDV